MDMNDENSIDEFALEILRRAKQRSQVITGGCRQPEYEREENIEHIMEKLDRGSSDTSMKSPEKLTTTAPAFPAKQIMARPILKQIDRNENAKRIEEQPVNKKSVVTYDADGDTIVEAKTFHSDGENSDDEDMQLQDEDDDDGKMHNDDCGDDNRQGQSHRYTDEDEEADTYDVNASATKDGSKGGRHMEATTPQGTRTLQKLADFHSKEVDSPVHPHTPLETLNHKKDEIYTGSHVSASRTARTSRLSALARTINEWEDDTTHHSVPGSRFSEVPNNITAASSSARGRFSSALFPLASSSPLNAGVRQGQIVGEFQGFSRRQVSPLKQIREKNPESKAGNAEEEMDEIRLSEQLQESPSKTYFGGSPFKGNQSPKKYSVPRPPSMSSQSPGRSPIKSLQGDEETEEMRLREQLQDSPSKTYFGGSPFKGNRSPKKYTAPLPPSMPSQSPGRSPIKSLQGFTGSPVKLTPPGVQSPARPLNVVAGSSQAGSPVKSPRKSRLSASPIKNPERTSSKESTPTANPVSAIRMQFEGSSQGKMGPAKPERSRAKPYSAPPQAFPMERKFTAASPGKRFQFGEESGKDPSCLSVAERAKLFEKSNFCPVPKKPVAVEVQAKRLATHVATTSYPIEEDKPMSAPSSPSKNVKRHAPPPPVAASPGCPPPPPPMPTTSTPTNFGSKRRSTSPSRSGPPEAHAVKRIKVNAPKPGRIYPSLTDIETEAETETEGHCSEVESMDDSLESQQSLGTEIETIAKACSPIRPVSGGRLPPRYRPSEDFSATFACATVDALIDEALEGQDMTGTTINFSTTAVEADNTVRDAASLENTLVQLATADSGADSSSTASPSPDVSVKENSALEELSFSEADTTASSSFTSSPTALSTFSALSSASNVESCKIAKTELKKNTLDTDQLCEQVKTEEENVPRQLVHTVSFYRRQQQQQKKVETCFALNDISEHPEYDESDEEVAVQKTHPLETIRKLEEEVEGRNLAIAQASKALNWCKALIGFSDSTEYIECERILLIETQRRLAMLNSIHRLKTEGALSHQRPTVFSPSKQEVSPSCKGNMKISDISITLRREFFGAHRAECQYHFICLLKNKHHIDHTPLLTYESQRQGSTLRFSSEFLLENLDPDFQINLEVYYLESAKEYLPHEAKYRINAKKDKQATSLLSPLLTPSKKSGKGDTLKSQFHSPVGPDTVKSTSFKFCGGLSIDISSLQRTYWGLDKASGPLSGGVNLKLVCTAMGGVEYKGFLTLFEDVSGFGAWVRRWCRLGPTVLEFWKYPEDESEGKKPPLGTLNLHECVTSRVRAAPRDVCARANTLLLVTTRAPHPNDRDTLVTSCHKGYTAVRHLISADTRDERDVWSQRLNKALANLRAWDPVAKQSVDDNLF